MTIKRIRIGTRKSDLAMIQTNEVKARLEEKYPDLEIVIVDAQNTLGDNILDQHLKDLSMKNPGLFTKDLEVNLAANLCDCIVHSLKDMPTRLPEGLKLASITKRADPRDAFVLRKDLIGTFENDSIDNLPKGSIIGTSSVRREALLREKFKDKEFKFKLIRGNVNSRLAKLDSGQYDATILAVAGLNRMGTEFKSRISQSLDPPKYLYGVSQGSLGIECREGDDELIKLIKEACSDQVSTFRCLAERALLRALEGGCQLPLGVASEFNVTEKILKISARILTIDGIDSVEQSLSSTVSSEEEARTAGENLAKSLIAAGGDKILNKFKNYSTGEKNLTRPTTYGSAAEPNTSARPS